MTTLPFWRPAQAIFAMTLPTVVGLALGVPSQLREFGGPSFGKGTIWAPKRPADVVPHVPETLV